jgi:hypothetical protein
MCQSAHLVVRCLGNESPAPPLTETGYASKILTFIKFLIIVHGIDFKFNKARRMPGIFYLILMVC